MGFCSGRIYDGWHYQSCQKKATVMREGKWYCGIHDPVKVQARKDKQEQAYKAKCCPSCGWKLEEYWAYCPHCGKKKTNKETKDNGNTKEP